MNIKNIEKYIQDKWLQGFLPGGNILLYANGSVVYFNSYSYYDPNNGKTKIYCSAICDTTITSLEKYEDDIWTNIDIFTSLPYDNRFIYGGDGGMGNKGYVACTDADNHLLWAYFFEFSNPIVKLEIEESILTCYSDNETVVTINLNDPVKIKVYTPDTTEERFRLKDYIRGETDKPDIVF